MVRHIQKRLTAGLMALTLLLSSVLMPAQVAFATAPVGGDVPLVEQEVQTLPEEEEPLQNEQEQDSDGTVNQQFSSSSQPIRTNERQDNGNQGQDQPVWCQTIGQGWIAVLGNENSGNNPNRLPLTVIPAGAEDDAYLQDGQVYVFNRDDDALKGLLDAECENQYGNLILIPAALETIDPCGLDNAYLDTSKLDDIDNITYWVNDSESQFGSEGSVTVQADEGYMLTLDGDRSSRYYTYDPAVDSGELCEATSRKPKFNDPCATSKDYFVVKKTDDVDYYWNDTLLETGKKYFVDDASKVIIEARVSDENYEIVNKTVYTYQFTDELCKPQVKLQATAECVGLNTSINAMLENPTRSTQYYEVVVTDGYGNELATKTVSVDAKSVEYLDPKTFSGDGEFTVWVYSFNKEKRGKLLAKKVLETECKDTFTPEIYKVDQAGKVLPDGIFSVEVCQYNEYRPNILFDQEENGCETYVGVAFGTDGNWFADNVDYDPFVPTTVTITEVVPPLGCKAAGPWTFEWNYIEKQDDFLALSRYEGEREHRDGAWDVGSNVFYLENDCTPPQGEEPPEEEPEPTVQVLSATTDQPMLAETGDARAPLLTLAVVMMLASVGVAVSPLLRRNEV